MKQQQIPQHTLKNGPHPGFNVFPWELSSVYFGEIDSLTRHRDQHYLFFLLEKGTVKMVTDFIEIKMTDNSLYYIAPGQVHYSPEYNITRGWVIAIESELIPEGHRTELEDQFADRYPCVLSHEQYQRFDRLLGLLEKSYREEITSPFQTDVMYGLLQAFTGMVSICWNKSQEEDEKSSRPILLSRQFKKLLKNQFREEKSPAAYAAQLHISASYLNDILKEVTGFTVSYWITQEVLLEAKRLLVHSQLDIKEIAHSLGYDDSTYFHRLFKKNCEITPANFRAKYRK